MNIIEKIIAQAEAMQEEMIAQRRDFHKYAESGWFEMRTTSIIARTGLRGLGGRGCMRPGCPYGCCG